MIKLAVFDFDGTLFMKTAEVNMLSMNQALAELGYPPISEEVANSTVGDTMDEISMKLIGTTEPEKRAELFSVLKGYVHKAVDKLGEIEPDAVTMLQTLKEKGYKIALCSNGDADYIETCLKKLDINKYFDAVKTNEYGMSKKYNIGELIYQFKPQKAVMTGDRWEDVTSGKVNGLKTVAIKNDFGDSNVEEADIIVYNHKEMLEAILKLIN